MPEYIERKARYIDAYSLGDKVFESKKNNPHCIDAIARNHNCEHEHFLKIIADEPTADVVEVKHGEWINKSTCVYQCSLCAGVALLDFKGEPCKYCPNCGAKMDLKEGAEE